MFGDDNPRAAASPASANRVLASRMENSMVHLRVRGSVTLRMLRATNQSPAAF